MTDMFGRLRVATPFTLLDTKSIYDAQTYMWDDAQVTGSGTTSTHNANQASVTLAVSATTAGKRVRQTLQRPNYQPGKSHLMMFSAVVGAGVAGITKRIGLFDDANGLFFEVVAGHINVVRRSSFDGTVQEYPVAQTSWNVDTMNATSSSGIRLDTSKANIYYITFEWLGVGDVEFGVVIDGKYRACHRMKHANRLTGVYMSTPNLPLRADITNDGTGAAAQLTVICGSIQSEGGAQATGYVRSIDRGINPLRARTDANVFVALAVRLNPLYSGATVQPLHVDIVTDSVEVTLWKLVQEPTFSGPALIYANTDSVQANIPGNTVYASGGVTVLSGYLPPTATTNKKTQAPPVAQTIDIPPSAAFGCKINGTSTVYALTIQSAALSSNVSNVYAGFNYSATV